MILAHSHNQNLLTKSECSYLLHAAPYGLPTVQRNQRDISRPLDAFSVKKNMSGIIASQLLFPIFIWSKFWHSIIGHPSCLNSCGYYLTHYWHNRKYSLKHVAKVRTRIYKIMNDINNNNSWLCMIWYVRLSSS